MRKGRRAAKTVGRNSLTEDQFRAVLEFGRAGPWSENDFTRRPCRVYSTPCGRVCLEYETRDETYDSLRTLTLSDAVLRALCCETSLTGIRSRANFGEWTYYLETAEEEEKEREYVWNTGDEEDGGGGSAGAGERLREGRR